jgi:NAD(P)H-flavin reductase
MTLVRVEPPEHLARSYGMPGQFVEVLIDGESGYFVLAGAPGAHPWELVMRPGGGASDVLLAAPVGRALEITAALGEGFPMDAARGRELVIALSGTGIAAGRPLVRRRLADGDAARTQVYVGTRTEAELALVADIDAWRDSGVNVVVCLSQYQGQGQGQGQGTGTGTGMGAGEAGRDARFAYGYVQEVIRERVTPGAWAHAHVFAVGVASMVQALRALAPELGLSPERVLTNH